MTNLFDYLHWRGDLTMEQADFNEVDALILARLSYVPFPMAADREITVAQAAELTRPEDISYPEDVDLLNALALSRRFGGMGLSGYVEQLDEKAQKQFSAVTVRMAPYRYFVSFRGTDNTLVGWKEDFNMSFLFPVPAQETAVDYFRRQAMEKSGDFVLGGHSEGGNLAVYTAAFSDPALQGRIRAVYNFDGPGFERSVLDMGQYQAMLDRITTFVPQSSIVGMLLEHEESYIVVNSSEKTGILQHNVYSWTVDRDRLCYVDRMTGSSRMIDRTLTGWISDMEPAQRERFFDALYAILTQTNARTLQEMGENWLETGKSILSTLKNLDEPTRNVLTHALSLLMKNARTSLTEDWKGQGEAGQL